MTRVWFSLKTSLPCKSDTSDVHDPNPKTQLPAISTGRLGCSFSRRAVNIRDVINGGSNISKRHFEKPPSHSPSSIESSEFLNSINHNVILCNSNRELEIGTAGAGGGSTFVGTPPSFRNSEKLSPFLISDSSEGEGGFAVTELVEGDSSRKIVEIIICRTSSMIKPENNKYSCSTIIMDKVLKVHNTQKTLARFEEYRESVKIRASKLHNNKKHPRCLADGNELLHFYATTISSSCSLNSKSHNSVCVSEDCCVCRIIRNGFSVKEEVKNRNKIGIGIFTAATSGTALESMEANDDNEDEGIEKKKKVLMVCRVIAGRVHRPLLENDEKDNNMVGEKQNNGFDSLAGKLGVYNSNNIIEELYLFNPSSLLPCFVVICNP